MRKNLLIAILASFVIADSGLAQCNSRYQNDLFTVDLITTQFGSNTRYNGAAQDLFMDLYLPKEDTAKNRPCLVFCFGGSFITGAKISPELVYFANYFAKKGYVCASIDYRIDDQINLFTGGEKSMFQAVVRAVQDGKAAIRYLNKMKDSLRIDPNQIFIGGTSAGGILAMNLAYIDSGDAMSANWKNWANELGGFEGNSGNPGYPVTLRGLFTFAGGVGDTSFLNPKDYPIYMCHAKDDQTVKSGYGKPLNGIAPISLYGSSTVKEAMDKMNIYNVYDEFPGGAHPPFISGVAFNYPALDTTSVHLKQFLYNLLPCNPAIAYIADPQPKSKLSSVLAFETNQAMIYPNPVSDFLTIQTKEDIEELTVTNQVGQRVISMKYVADMDKIDFRQLPKGAYVVQWRSRTESNGKLIVRE